MYMIPQKHICPKCKFEFQWSIHYDAYGLGKPYCPKCYIEFLDANIPLGLRDEI